MDPSHIEVSVARYALGLLSAEAAMRQADEILGEGVFSDSASELEYLRFEPVFDRDEAVALFGRMLTELEIALPTRDEAIWTLARHHVGRIASGVVAPKEGLSDLRSELYLAAQLYDMDLHFVGDSFDLQDLLGLYYSYDSLIGFLESGLTYHGESTLEGCERAMGEEAKRLAVEWLAAHGLTSASSRRLEASGASRMGESGAADAPTR